MRPKDISSWGIVIISAILFICGFWFTNVFLGTTNIITWDVYGYYVYLPALFNFQELGSFDFVQEVHFPKYNVSAGSLYQLSQFENGKAVPIYTLGLSILFLPFYLLAYVWAALSSYPNDGLSHPFQVGIVTAVVCYSILGLVYLRRILLPHFSQAVILLTLVGVTLGTNYYNYSTYEGGMPHVYLFSLYAILIYYTIEWHKTQKVSHTIYIGSMIAILCLARPSEIVCLFIPILYGVYSKDSLKEKVQLVAKHWKQVLILIVTGLIWISPQVLLWKLNSGHWIYNSYSADGHDFHFSHPHILEGLFSYRKGWLIYTPIMYFAILGIPLLYKTYKKLFWGMLLYFIANIYFVLSWHMWWYAGCFGMRAFIQSYAVWALPFACAMHYIYTERKFLRWVALPIYGFLVLLNIFQTWQFHHRILALDGITSTFYWNAWGRTQKDISLNKYLEIDEQLNGKEDYPKNSLSTIDFNAASEGMGNYKKKPAQEITKPNFSKTILYNITEENILQLKNNWVEVKTMILNDGDLFGFQTAKLILSFEHSPDEVYKWIGVGFQKCIAIDEWTSFDYETKVPDELKVGDLVKVYIWNESPDKIYLNKLELNLIQTR
ncbi:MAG: hypothetical protein GY810_18355 [Aureispira sp.]|nr:hypothetical protein [Aureispira sp.]